MRTLDRCFWCGKRNRQASDWEQENYAKGWQRLCKPCARVRLNNPWNALLSMRKVAAEPERTTTPERSRTIADEIERK